MPRPGGEDRGLYQRNKKDCPKCRGDKIVDDVICPTCDGKGKVGTGPWSICYLGTDDKIHREQIGPKSLALDMYNKRKAQVLAGEEMGHARRKRMPTVKQAAQAYLDGPGSGKASWKDDRKFAALWVERIGDKHLDEVLPSDVLAAKVEWVEQGYAPSSVNHRLNFLRRVFTLAVDDGTVPLNPVSKVERIAEDHSRVRWMDEETEEKVRALFLSGAKVTVPAPSKKKKPTETNLKPRDWEIVELAYLTGLRQGDQFWMRRDSIDWTTGIATIVMGKTSRHARVVRVHLSSRAQEIIRCRLSEHDSEWVFVGPRGQRMDAHNWCARVLKPALEAAGVKDFTFRDLRHTYATRLRLEGVDIADIAEGLGHSGLEMVQRYAHITNERKREIAERLVRKRSDTHSDTASGEPHEC